MPAEVGEKVGVQLNILLSFSVMLLVMGDTTPKSGRTTPLISMYAREDKMYVHHWKKSSDITFRNMILLC